jgi:hypothetical protein
VCHRDCRPPSFRPCGIGDLISYQNNGKGSTAIAGKVDGALRDRMGAIVRPLTLATVAGVAVSAAVLPVATTARLDLAEWTAGYRSATRCSWRRPDSGPPTGGRPERQTGSRSSRSPPAEAAGLVALLALYYPQIVPPSVTLYSSAASRETLAFLVIAIGVIGPVTIAYHGYANWVFRGRQPLDEGSIPPGHRAAPSQLSAAAEPATTALRWPAGHAGHAGLAGAAWARGGIAVRGLMARMGDESALTVGRLDLPAGGLVVVAGAGDRGEHGACESSGCGAAPGGWRPVLQEPPGVARLPSAEALGKFGVDGVQVGGGWPVHGRPGSHQADAGGQVSPGVPEFVVGHVLDLLGDIVFTHCGPLSSRGLPLRPRPPQGPCGGRPGPGRFRRCP